jgi:hypothetical protein
MDAPAVATIGHTASFGRSASPIMNFAKVSRTQRR